jgi:RimJ/RimL family protein N-acetyltransferase
MAWLPDDFRVPGRLELPTGHHLRPIREADVEIDYPAVMGSRDRLWRKYGEPWGWPPEDMTYEQDRVDLARHETEIEARESFNYAVLDAAEQTLLGCLYIDPVEEEGIDADVSWWVVDASVATDLESALSTLVPRWIGDAWPFPNVRYRP